jgi:SAM-dependent methyltransferase
MEPDHYDTFAERYARENESGLLNNYYERPAVLSLLGDVEGRRVLDVGCGAGPLSALLVARGASVVGFDASPAMVRLARQRLGPDAALLVADLRAPLPFRGGEFDVAVASLVLHYLEDWSGPLRELRRVLASGGRLVLSVNHPAMYKIVNPAEDYFATVRYYEEWTLEDHTAVLTFWHRPLSAMTSAFTDAGFRISVLAEPPWAPGTPPDLVADFAGRTAFLCFLFFVLEAA